MWPLRASNSPALRSHVWGQALLRNRHESVEARAQTRMWPLHDSNPIELARRANEAQAAFLLRVGSPMPVS
jgi:hypothetical protein